MKKITACILAMAMAFTFASCGKQEGNQTQQTGGAASSETAEASQDIKSRLLEAAGTLEPSQNLYFEDGLTISGLAVNWSGDSVNYNDNYYWKAIENLTGVHLDLKWEDEENYPSAMAATLLGGEDDLPDIINAVNFGIMDLVDDGSLVPLDDYLDLIPDIVAAVGEERMSAWRMLDGHIYTIPSVVDVPGAQTMMVRQDWLDQLNMDAPTTWEEWVELWRAIRDNDLNGNGDPTDEIPFTSQFGYDGARCFLPLMNAFGIKTANDCQFCLLDDGTYALAYEHPRYAEFLEAMQDLYAEGLLDPIFDERIQEEQEAAMDANLVGTTFAWAEMCRASSRTLRENGVEGALWKAVAPVAGPHGDQLTQERNKISSIWCITSEAVKTGKIEDILRFFNWCYTPEGSALYSYGIEGVSYQLRDGAAILEKELTENGFDSYRAAGCNVESFGGLWQEDAFMQCLFAGKEEAELNDMDQAFYEGIAVVNDDYFYTMPKVYETDAYVKYRDSVLVSALCRARNRTIKGELTTKEFWKGYEALKPNGLQTILDDTAALAEELRAAEEAAK